MRKPIALAALALSAVLFVGTQPAIAAGRTFLGTDTSLGQSFFLWVTGVVLMKGTFDMKTGVFLVSSKTILGQVTPLCDSLTTGLKPRH